MQQRAEPAASLLGETLGPYQLNKLVGQGGSSNVYLAEDLVLARQVAVKVAKSPDRYEACRSEFERQTQTIGARVEHPAIVSIYGWDEVDGRPYLAMEFIDGETLLELLRARLRLRWPQALQITRDLCDALAAAHRLGVIHRDVKPENILVTRDGAAKLTDFYAEGAASLLNADGDYDYFGTPGYSSPEQVRGDEDRIGARSDLFCLGVVLYEMLEGVPFHGHGETTRLLARTLNRTGVPRMRAGPDIPAPVAKLVNNLVQASPRRRPSDAVAALAMIDRCLSKCS